MATATISGREVMSWGRFRAETGKFTSTGSGTIEVKTKLSKLIYIQTASMGTVAVGEIGTFYNSVSGSFTEDDPGWFAITSAPSAGDYTYFVVGY